MSVKKLFHAASVCRLEMAEMSTWGDFPLVPVSSASVRSSVVVPDGLSYSLSNTICLSASKKYEQKPAMAVVGPPTLFLRESQSEKVEGDG